MNLKLTIAKYLFVMSFILMGFSTVQAVSLQFQPIFENPRFEPANILHAGCLNSADILIVSDVAENRKLSAQLEYNPDDLDIVRVESIADGLNYDLNYDNVQFSKNNIEIGATKLFRLYFKSNIDLTGTTIGLIVDDEVQEFSFSFASVSECQPDIIPPTIRLVSPKNGSDNVSLDSLFVFDLKDSGKGLDKETIRVYLDGTLYDNDSENLDWSGSQVVVFPSEWLPVGQELMIDVRVSDQQKYGGANEVKKQFKVITATGVLLDSAIEPTKLRGLIQGTLVAQGTSSECALLQKIYANSNIYYKYKVRKILNKLSCEIPEENVQGYSDTELMDGDTSTTGNIVYAEVNKLEKFSVFCILGWVLFVITLILKMYYFASHKKYKRKEKKARNFGK